MSMLGPKLTNRQFVRAIATASIVKPQIGKHQGREVSAWNVLDADADWDDESGQVELRIEAQVGLYGREPECDYQWLRISRNDSRGAPC